MRPDELIVIRDRPARKVHVPQWGRDVYVRSMSTADIANAEQMDRVQLAVAGLCDVNGNGLAWTEQHRLSLYLKHPAALDAIALEVLKASGLREDDQPQLEPKRTSMPTSEWEAVQKSLRSVAHASHRRAGNPDNCEHGPVRESNEASQ